jgi:hypothetical protein
LEENKSIKFPSWPHRESASPQDNRLFTKRINAGRELSLTPPPHNTMSLAYKFVDSPMGKLKLVVSTKGLVAILWEHDSRRCVRLTMYFYTQGVSADKRLASGGQTDLLMGVYCHGKSTVPFRTVDF